MGHATRNIPRLYWHTRIYGWAWRISSSLGNSLKKSLSLSNGAVSSARPCSRMAGFIGTDGCGSVGAMAFAARNRLDAHFLSLGVEKFSIHSRSPPGPSSNFIWSVSVLNRSSKIALNLLGSFSFWAATNCSFTWRWSARDFSASLRPSSPIVSSIGYMTTSSAAECRQTSHTNWLNHLCASSPVLFLYMSKYRRISSWSTRMSAIRSGSSGCSRVIAVSHLRWRRTVTSSNARPRSDNVFANE